MKLTLLSKDNLISNIWSFHLKPEQPVTWQPGQYMYYELKHEGSDDRGEKRWFTIASAPSEGFLQITTRFAGKESSSFKKMLFNLPLGSELEATGPEGDFTLNDTSRSVIFVAGGIGITPFRSIIRELANQSQKIPITLVYANRDDQFVFKDEFDEISGTHPEFTVHYLPNQQLDVATIEKTVPDFREQVLYLSGPELMVEAVGDALRAAGHSDKKLKQDFFPGYPSI